MPRESNFPAIVQQKYINGLSLEKIEESVISNLTLTRPTKFYDIEFMSIFQ